MKNDFKIFSDKITKMINFMYSEYDKINLNYADDMIIRKSFPITASSNLDESKKNDINSLIYVMFSPSLIEMSKMIDDGIIEWEEVSKSVDLNKIPQDELSLKENVVDLLYQAHERLYFYKKIKYNIFFDFLMQIYLFFESEINKFVQKNIDNSIMDIYFSVACLERNLNNKINCEFKDKIYLYKNIINVYKHGYGRSFKNIVKLYPDILNYTEEYEDMDFVFDLNKISIREFIDAIESFNRDIYLKI